MSNELIHDVEESLKQERLHALWKEYGPYLIAGVVLAVLFTAMISGYRSWQYKVNAASTATLIRAMSGEEVAEAIAGIDGELRPGQFTIAKLSQASMYLQNGETEKAYNAFNALAEESSVPALYRDLARVEAVRVGWGEGLEAVDTASALQSLKPIYSDKANPWHYHALYQAALISGESQQDYKAARDYLSRIVNAPAAAPTLIQMARALDGVYSQKESDGADQAATK